jgi:hypothetical protein
MQNDDILYSWFPMLVTPDIVDLCGDAQAEKRVDPLLDGQAVTFAKMRPESTSTRCMCSHGSDNPNNTMPITPGFKIRECIACRLATSCNQDS